MLFNWMKKSKNDFIDQNKSYSIKIGLMEPPKEYGKNSGLRGTGKLYTADNEIILFYKRNTDNEVLGWSVAGIIMVFICCSLWSDIYSKIPYNSIVLIFIFICIIEIFDFLLKPKPVPMSIDMKKYRVLL